MLPCVGCVGVILGERCWHSPFPLAMACCDSRPGFCCLKSPSVVYLHSFRHPLWATSVYTDFDKSNFHTKQTGEMRTLTETVSFDPRNFQEPQHANAFAFGPFALTTTDVEQGITARRPTSLQRSAAGNQLKSLISQEFRKRCAELNSAKTVLSDNCYMYLNTLVIGGVVVQKAGCTLLRSLGRPRTLLEDERCSSFIKLESLR